MLQVTLWDKRLVATNGFLGQFSVPLRDLRDQQHKKQWFSLLSKDGEIVLGGLIELRLEYIFSEVHSFMGAFTAEEETEGEEELVQYR